MGTNQVLSLAGFIIPGPDRPVIIRLQVNAGQQIPCFRSVSEVKSSYIHHRQYRWSETTPDNPHPHHFRRRAALPSLPTNIAGVV